MASDMGRGDSHVSRLVFPCSLKACLSSDYGSFFFSYHIVIGELSDCLIIELCSRRDTVLIGLFLNSSNSSHLVYLVYMPMITS